MHITIPHILLMSALVQGSAIPFDKSSVGQTQDTDCSAVRKAQFFDLSPALLDQKFNHHERHAAERPEEDIVSMVEKRKAINDIVGAMETENQKRGSGGGGGGRSSSTSSGSSSTGSGSGSGSGKGSSSSSNSSGKGGSSSSSSTINNSGAGGSSAAVQVKSSLAWCLVTISVLLVTIG